MIAQIGDYVVYVVSGKSQRGMAEVWGDRRETDLHVKSHKCKEWDRVGGSIACQVREDPHQEIDGLRCTGLGFQHYSIWFVRSGV